MEGSGKNPFSALLAVEVRPDQGINKDLIEKVFLFTLRKTSPNAKILLSLADIIVQDTGEKDVMSEELLSHALFERLMVTNPEEYLIPGQTSTDEKIKDAVDTRAISYLYRAFVACKSEEAYYPQDCSKVQKLILTNVSTCMRQPELFQGQSLSHQWLQIFESAESEEDPLIQEFLVQTVNSVLKDDDKIDILGVLKAIFYPMFNEMQKLLLNANIITLKRNILWVLGYFVRDKRATQLGEILIDYTTPNPNASGAAYAETLFGQLLCMSILPKNSNGPFEFFSDVSLESAYTDPSLWQFMSRHQNYLFAIFRQLLLLGSTSKKKTLQWIANCLAANTSRGQLWSNMELNIQLLANQSASDSFMLSLTAILLRLCTPLCHPQMKVLIVDPTYCAVSDEERTEKQISMIKANEETCMLPLPDGEGPRVTAEKYNFVTELFYMTHKSLELGYRVCIEKYTRMTRELHNLQNAYQDAALISPNGDIAQNILRMLKLQMQQYLCLRNCLMEPQTDTFLLKFFEASAIWLTEIALVTEEQFEVALQKKDFAPHRQRQITIPNRVSFIPAYLSSVPESIIDNIVAYLSFSRHFPPGQFIEIYQQSHDAFFKMIILFMGRSELVTNPHLRAKLAEALEFLLPQEISGSMRHAFVTNIFDTHPDRLKVVESLLNVFVSIEMTGQSVQFEQKFNYRRPMYAIMQFLWTKPEQVQCFRDLAKEAELNMEAINPPLFLRFINLLINDAIFLLDESLSNLQQIRQLQEAQDKGEWIGLSANERQQHLSNLQHLGMLTRIDNILGRDTINNLKLLTTEIKSTFCHNSMVDRIASMLNYFLLNLVGPQKEKFKVKDKKEFEFDPAQTVLEICRIYINLGSSDNFCLAVFQDGRSYSSQLFEYAENILIRIGGGQLIGELSEFSDKVKQMELKYKQEQEFIADAPEEFLDPIMSTLMIDPVTLPSSNVTVDRSTIARHLLSDQTDPFNRAPLTMDKVKSNDALKADIEKWKAEKRAAGKSSS